MDNIEDFEDETVMERIMALEEMIPETMKRTVSTSFSWIKTTFNAAKTVTWAIATTAAILVLPLSVEMERQEYLEQMKRQERDIILGGPQQGIM